MIWSPNLHNLSTTPSVAGKKPSKQNIVLVWPRILKKYHAVNSLFLKTVIRRDWIVIVMMKMFLVDGTKDWGQGAVRMLGGKYLPLCTGCHLS